MNAGDRDLIGNDETWLEIACWIAADLALIGADAGKSTLNLSPLTSPSQGTVAIFGGARAIGFRAEAAAPAGGGSFSGGFLGSPSGQVSRAARTCGCHSFAHPT